MKHMEQYIPALFVWYGTNVGIRTRIIYIAPPNQKTGCMQLLCLCQIIAEHSFATKSGFSEFQTTEVHVLQVPSQSSICLDVAGIPDRPVSTNQQSSGAGASTKRSSCTLYTTWSFWRTFAETNSFFSPQLCISCSPCFVLVSPHLWIRHLYT